MEVLPSGEITPLSSSGLAIPLFPAPRLLQAKYIVMSVYFSIKTNSLPAGNTVLLSFARTSGCVLYVTGTRAGPTSGFLGLKCYKHGQVISTQQVTRWPEGFSLRKGTHKVALLFSTDASVPFRVFVNGLCVITMKNPGGWDLTQASNTVRLFSDRNFWQYVNLQASLKRFSLVVSANVEKIEQVAKRIALNEEDIQPLEQDSDFETESVLQTRWENCTFIASATPSQAAVRCDLIPLRDHVPVAIPPSLLRPACSRSRCSLLISGSTGGRPVDKYSVTYKPLYPATFNSENVGAPPLFPDPSIVTDGWSTLQIVFDIRYAPDGSPMNVSKVETDASTYQVDMLQTESRVQVADVMKYVFVETKANSNVIRPIVIDDTVF
eukprot:TRINITY_DN2639_c0_g1_i12.p1 TRINITY_DN2639_c0_g1~~TRINITY_DN2639_c0_g1_i12.p1  ORF type:complete len:380 (+),score=82.19 TRINITY_DN2639_c0_g1_i12:130-1269(+)